MKKNFYDLKFKFYFYNYNLIELNLNKLLKDNFNLSKLKNQFQYIGCGSKFSWIFNGIIYFF
jgi:hypothetical protein